MCNHRSRAELFVLILCAGVMGMTGARLARGASIRAWGRNQRGQLGDGTITDRLTPVDVINLSDGVTAIAEGTNHSLAVQNGAVYSWGFNDQGRLGDGTEDEHHSPMPVTDLSSGVTAVAAGNSHSLALKGGGIYAWGNNNNGQLGDGTTTERHTPVGVTNLSSGVTAIAAGYDFNLALQGGHVYAWGDNNYSELGNNNSPTDSSIPVSVLNLTSGVTDIAAGAYHGLALKGGHVYAWGRNTYGQLGNGESNNNIDTPVEITGLDNVIAISGGYAHSLALTSDGTLYAWGRNNKGQLGDNSLVDKDSPFSITGITGTIIDIAADRDSSYALTSDGSLWIWGDNVYGQIGQGYQTSPIMTPQHLLPPDGFRYTLIGESPYGSHILTLLSVVPEPSSLSLLLFGGLGLLIRRRH